MVAAASAAKLSTPCVCMVSISMARAALPEKGLTSAVGRASTNRVSMPMASTPQRIPSSAYPRAPEVRSTPTAQSMATK